MPQGVFHAGQEQGLYNIPGLTIPEAFFQLCEDVEGACGRLLHQIVALDVISSSSGEGDCMSASFFRSLRLADVPMLGKAECYFWRLNPF